MEQLDENTEQRGRPVAHVQAGSGAKTRG